MRPVGETTEWLDVEAQRGTSNQPESASERYVPDQLGCPCDGANRDSRCAGFPLGCVAMMGRSSSSSTASARCGAGPCGADRVACRFWHDEDRGELAGHRVRCFNRKPPGDPAGPRSECACGQSEMEPSSFRTRRRAPDHRERAGVHRGPSRRGARTPTGAACVSWRCSGVPGRGDQEPDGTCWYPPP